MWGNVGVGAQYECVCACVCVLWGVGRLTQLPPLWHRPLQLQLVRTSLCLQMPSYKHTHTHTHIYTNTSLQRQTDTHSPKPNPFPEINYLKLYKNAENKTNLFSCFPAGLFAVSCQALGRSVRLSVSRLWGPLWNPNAVAPQILTAT